MSMRAQLSREVRRMPGRWVILLGLTCSLSVGAMVRGEEAADLPEPAYLVGLPAPVHEVQLISDSIDCGPCCAEPFYAVPCCERPAWAHRSGAYGEFLWLHPTGADVAHAQQQNGTGAPGDAGTTPFGTIGTTDPHHEPGFRLGFSCCLDQCSSLVAQYTWLETETTDRVDQPVIGLGLGTVGSLVHHPNAVVTSSAGPVDARYQIDFQLADVLYRRLMVGCGRHWVNYSLGVRYAHLDQSFVQSGNFAGGAGGAIDTATDIDFDGIGVHVGLDGERMIGCHGLSIYGKSSLSALSGEYRSNYRMRNTTGAVDLAIVNWDDDRITSMLEYELGFAWTSCSRSCRFSFGYLGMHWFNTVTTPSFINAVRADNYGDVGDTLSFNGLASRVEYRW